MLENTFAVGDSELSFVQNIGVVSFIIISEWPLWVAIQKQFCTIALITSIASTEMKEGFWYVV